MGKQFYASDADASRFARSMHRVLASEGPYTLTSIRVLNSDLPEPIPLVGREAGTMYAFDEGQFPPGTPTCEPTMKVPPSP
ncbi:MAG: hypothetical protein JWL76_1454 [Thermoleophilia bacterium]|nr:hypothetical protein [Thermoleophilia bacterium]